MNISNLLSDEEFYYAVQKKIANTPSLKPAKYHGEYPKWIRQFKAGHPMSHIATLTEADVNTVEEALYAADLKNYITNVREETAMDWMLDYFVNDMTQSEIAEGAGVSPRSVSRVVRGVVQRFFLEEKYSEEDFEEEEFTEEEKAEVRKKLKESNTSTNPKDTKSEEELAEKWKKENNELGPNGRNVSARVVKTEQVA